MNYEAPTEEVFCEMRETAIKLWSDYDDTHGYATEKIKRVDSITNVQDNAMVFYRMFDMSNQSKMRAELSCDANDYIYDNQ